MLYVPYTLLSPFIGVIIDRFERRMGPAATAAAPGATPRPDVRVDLKGRMRGMWR